MKNSDKNNDKNQGPFGLSESEFHYIWEEVVIPLRGTGVEVYCFGPRARGDHQKFSDLDLLIDNLGLEIKNLVNNLREKLEEGPFPLKVDLVLLSEVPASYLPQILEQKKKISP